jgi:hypothetical protein
VAAVHAVPRTATSAIRHIQPLVRVS